MGLFKKNKKQISQFSNQDMIPPRTPQLPELPKLPSRDFQMQKEPLSQLPSLPGNPFGNKFSQDTIKEAVSGKKEVRGEANDFGNSYESDSYESDYQMMPEPPETQDFDEMEFEDEPEEENYEESPYQKSSQTRMNLMKQSYTKKAEPIFIRLDKFEESLEVFEKAKEQIKEIEEELKHIRHLKNQENEELIRWENEIQNLKNQVERVDKDIFSKVQ